ncbi:UNVERIFIED_CONTAM: Retrovirus-related Pol polyprotein from transposon TNT 1-94 [Sesamum calycinum]|uniref:Retrovirus-related Pol polyprotein from transposon TNT 1-94 n=1 Tax=Sesamum calycinum TaxID=2727403 RepID=A0AAW2NIP6_9LAMI
MNRTLLNKVRCLLISSGLAKSFWGEALLTAAYLINRSPSVPLLGKVPEHVWSGKNVDLSSLRVFGCSAFVFQNNDKLEPRAQKCVFIGYPEGVKGYRLWLRNQTGFKVVISKDVTFNESEMPCLNNSSRTELDFRATAVPLAAHFQLCKEQSPKNETETEQMKNIPYSNAIGSVMYLMVSTRPDIAYAVSCLSRYMSNAGLPHWEALKWLLRYLNGSVNAGINFSKHADGVSLVGYVDSNYANDRDSRRSTTSYVFTLCGACISWKSQLQNIVALSTTEAEYIATTEAFKEAIWPGILTEIGFLNKKVLLLCAPVSFGNDEAHFRPLGFGPRWNMLKYWPKSSLAQKPSFTGWRTPRFEPTGLPTPPTRPATRFGLSLLYQTLTLV